MLQSFIIVLREGFESFLLIAVILAYLRKTGRERLTFAVYWAIGISLAVSTALAYVLKNGVDSDVVGRAFGKTFGYYVNQFFANESLREGILGVVAIVMVASLVIHMLRSGSKLKGKMEHRLSQVSSGSSRFVAITGVFLFTFLMMTREGMETALMLLQIHEGWVVVGMLLGLVAAGGLAWSWAHFGHLINVKRFFQVTAVFLLLFMAQVGIYSFHELCEAGIFPNSDAMHEATEIFSPTGLYGKWFSLAMVGVCGLWLLYGWLADRLKQSRGSQLPQLSGQG